MIKIRVEGTKNNLFIVVYDNDKVMVSKSIGNYGFKNSEKKTEFGAYTMGKVLANDLLSKGINNAEIELIGQWKKKEKGFVRGLGDTYLKFDGISYFMTTAHNGVYKRKLKRR